MLFYAFLWVAIVVNVLLLIDLVKKCMYLVYRWKCHLLSHFRHQIKLANHEQEPPENTYVPCFFTLFPGQFPYLHRVCRIQIMSAKNA
jgi:hypothetical protein